MSYTKLFSEIIHSTIWVEPQPTKIMWITMLAMSDDRQEVRASIPGLAKAAGVTMKECEAALKCFMSPDKYSRSQEFKGRRIEPVDGGWRLLNGKKYRDLRSAEDRREYQRKFMAAKRAKEKKPKTVAGKNKHFEAWYKTYPKKVAKAEALKIWKKMKLDDMADILIADTVNRVNCSKWKRGYIKDPERYLKSKQWEDELQTEVEPQRKQTMLERLNDSSRQFEEDINNFGEQPNEQIKDEGLAKLPSR